MKTPGLDCSIQKKNPFPHFPHFPHYDSIHKNHPSTHSSLFMTGFRLYMKSAVNQTQPAIVMEIPLKEDSNVYKLEDLEPNQSYNFQMRYMTEVRNNIHAFFHMQCFFRSRLKCCFSAVFAITSFSLVFHPKNSKILFIHFSLSFILKYPFVLTFQLFFGISRLCLIP